MNSLRSLVLALTLLFPWPAVSESSPYDDAEQFIFFSVLEGLYRDGVSNDDLEKMMVIEEGKYRSFIYACPICTVVIGALETYRARPNKFYGLKTNKTTFGKGLTADLQDKLASDKPQQRLVAINSLVNRWLEERMERMRLSEGEQKSLELAFAKKRERGMEMLKAGHKGADFADIDECAACNGVVGEPMTKPVSLLPDEKK